MSISVSRGRGINKVEDDCPDLSPYQSTESSDDTVVSPDGPNGGFSVQIAFHDTSYGPKIPLAPRQRISKTPYFSPPSMDLTFDDDCENNELPDSDVLDCSRALKDYVPRIFESPRREVWTWPNEPLDAPTGIRAERQQTGTAPPDHRSPQAVTPFQRSQISMSPSKKHYKRSRDEDWILSGFIALHLTVTVTGRALSDFDTKSRKRLLRGILSIMCSLQVQASTSLFFLAMLYIDKLYWHGPILLKDVNIDDAIDIIARAFSLGLVLASKYMVDTRITLSLWDSDVLRDLTVPQMSQLELAALDVLDWNLYVSTEAWISWIEEFHCQPVFNGVDQYPELTRLVDHVLAEIVEVFGEDEMLRPPQQYTPPLYDPRKRAIFDARIKVGLRQNDMHSHLQKGKAIFQLCQSPKAVAFPRARAPPKRPVMAGAPTEAVMLVLFALLHHLGKMGLSMVEYYLGDFGRQLFSADPSRPRN